MDVITLAKDSLKKHEGFRGKPYLCTAGKTTIGYGRNLDANPLTEREAMFLLENDIVDCLNDLKTRSYWGELSNYQQAALINLRFNLGAAGFASFKMMGKALEMGDYTEAAYQVLNSKYHDQVGKRAEDVAKWLTTL